MELLLAFTDPSASFVNGVEFGRLLGQMEAGQPVVENLGFPVHRENAQVLKRAARQYGYAPLFGPCLDEKGVIYTEWLAFRAVKSPALN